MKSKPLKSKHNWNEIMIIMVMVTSALCILVMLAGYVATSGKAYSIVPSADGVISMLNSATIHAGEGSTKCSTVCVKAKKICLLAHYEDKLVSCAEVITGKYSCLCTATQKIVAAVPQ